MTPRSQLQPGQGITPEPKLSAEKEYRKCNDYFHFHVWDLSIKLGGVIVYYLKMMIDLISFLMLFCLLFTRQSFAAFTPGQDIERREERERRGQWAAFIGVKSDYCWCCSLHCGKPGRRTRMFSYKHFTAIPEVPEDSLEVV